MRTEILKSNKKLVALFMVAVYAWMSTVLQFAHTDDIKFSPSGAPVKSSPVGHLNTSPALEGPCLACEWIASAHGASPITSHVDFEPQNVAAYSASLPLSLHLRSVHQPLLRGPPALIG